MKRKNLNSYPSPQHATDINLGFACFRSNNPEWFILFIIRIRCKRVVVNLFMKRFQKNLIILEYKKNAPPAGEALVALRRLFQHKFDLLDLVVLDVQQFKIIRLRLKCFTDLIVRSLCLDETGNRIDFLGVSKRQVKPFF